MLTAVGHLENYGYVKRLRTSQGEQRILLAAGTAQQPGVVLRAGGAAESEGAGCAGGEDGCWPAATRFPELEKLARSRARRAAGLRGLAVPGAHVCFRETDPLRMEPYLVFPELINLKKPLEDEAGDRGWRGLYGQRPDGERVCLAGGAAGLYAHLHAHQPMAEQRPLRGGRRPGVRLPAGGRTRRRTGLRALLRSRRRPAGADAVPGAVRELPGPAEPDGDALTSRCVASNAAHPCWTGSVVRQRMKEGQTSPSATSAARS